MDIKQIKEAFDSKVAEYQKIESYYTGKTDANVNYRQNAGRSNLKVSCNYLKKFVKEETSYSVGNPISYASKGNNPAIQEVLDEAIENFKENHDTTVFTNMVLFGLAYEVYFIDKWGEIQVKNIPPTQGHHLEDNEGNTTDFIHVFSRTDEKGKVKEYIDHYTSEAIFHYDEDFNAVLEPTIHYFGEVPAGVAKLTEYGTEDTIYNDIKGLQDALETNLSDITNEVSDFRSAYMVTKGLDLGEDAAERDTTAKEMKERGILEVAEDGNIEWLIKNINDTFVQNTLKVLQEKMYELTSHINHNDSESLGNASGVALKSRLISLMQRCVFNQNSFRELLKTRIRVIFTINTKLGKALNWKDVKINFTPCIPSDDLQVAQMVQMLDGVISKQTMRGLFSFVENPAEEEAKIKTELQDTYGSDLNNEEDEEEV